jgi:hypothetical protein
MGACCVRKQHHPSHNLTQDRQQTVAKENRKGISALPNAGADGGTRTHDLLFTNQKEYVSTIAFWCVISLSDALDHPAVSRKFLHQQATSRSVEQTT